MRLLSWWRVADPASAGAVLPVELFFDLVFVFTLTQLSHTLHAHLSVETLGRVVLVFGVLWWMYGGYAWLTNHVPPRLPSQRLLLFVGMAGFFLAAVAVPDAFDGTGILFGVGYLIVVLVHLLLFAQSSMRAGVARLAPFNILSALLVLVAGFLTGPAVFALWSAALLIMIVTPYLSRPAGPAIAASFQLAPAHFVERHGLLVIIALGESVIAIGMGVAGERVSAGTAGTIVLALALPAALWWTYFADTHAAEHALGRADDATRGRLAIRAYFFAHIPLMLGIVIAATGTRAALHDAAHAVPWGTALALSGGVALVIAGIAEVRRALGVGALTAHYLTATLVLAAIPLARAAAVAQLTAVVVIAVLVANRSRTVPRGRPTAP